MTQASITAWVKPKPKKPEKPKKPIPARKAAREPVRWAYRFLIDLPEGLMLPGEKPVPPIRKGDLVSKNALPPAVWGVLLQRGAVEPYQIGGVTGVGKA